MKDQLPAEFLTHLDRLEAAYLSSDDPRRQSGFNGGLERWRAERAPILDALRGSGDLLDVGCANGYLLECLVSWGAERGLALTPFGVDCSARLIALARQRLPRFASHFFVANVWRWSPPRRFHYVYSVYDCVPPAYFAAFVEHLAGEVTAPGGRLILGAYGSGTRGQAPAAIDRLLVESGFSVIGSTTAGVPQMARFAWIDVDQHKARKACPT
jgi:SAM-dependent methyltransferase